MRKEAVEQILADLPKHYFAIHHKKYTSQPLQHEMGKLTNDFKRIGSGTRYSINDLFIACGSGQSIIPSNFEIEEDGSILGKFRFVSSSLILIDVDDINCKTDPNAVLNKLKDICSGLFYTFNHGFKGHRYRLVFQLDRPLTDEFLYKRVTELLADDLSQLGVPVDRQAKNPTLPIRTGIKGYVINDFSAFLNVTEYTERAKREQVKKAEKIKQSFDTEMKYKTTFLELKEMAEKVGYISTGSGLGEVWKSIVVGIKHHANSGAITQDEGWQLFDIVSGGEQSPKSWETLQASGQATIATLVYHAIENGYKRKPYRYALENVRKQYHNERHKVKTHIPIELATDLIERKQRILVDSPTGSGKSTSFIGASKQLASSDNYKFYIFSVPTRALVEQLAKKHQVLSVKGETEGIYKAIFAYQKAGNRVFITTYDMAANLMNCLEDWFPNKARFCLIVDEIHKYVTDYSRAYRYEAITNLHDASLRATSFIGLSGTTNDVLKSEFDAIVEIDNGRASSPCQEFAVYTYDKQKDAIPLLVQLIEAWTIRRKLLIYVQSKENLSKLYNLLRKRGIVTRTVSAAEKKNRTYKSLVENETVPDDVQVILATSVIADGLNIANNLEWECIVVANHFSDMFNVSTLKQCSNRFRNEYRRFSIFMQKPTNQETELFNIDGAYDYIYSLSNRFADTLNKEFSSKDLSLFRASIIEKEYGLYADNESVKIDTFFLRHEAGKAQERFYRGRRLSFIKAIERILHKKNVGTLNLNEAVANKTLDLSTIEKELSELEETIELDHDTRKGNLEKLFTKDIFRAFQDRDELILSDFKELVLPEQYACIERLYGITDFNICRKIVLLWKRKADTYAFYNKVQRLVDIWHFESLVRTTETKKIYKELVKLGERGALDKDFIEKQVMLIARKQRVQVEKVKKVLKQFFFKQYERTETVRFTRITPLNIEVIATSFDMDCATLRKVIGNYAQLQNKTMRVVIESVLNRLEAAEQAELQLI
ncbi:DEAD/DEAH box helicase [Lysinibacillus varians]|uniref:DEAD/DEAH box helicase n=2 Tax=Lysinibacillus varians TaxID=1145276 RepID=A0ABY2T5Z0_9BACI|nr:hypothetical protein T479_12315 [Lysinibacillus varians]TKI52650.1 DEAD/DEAH box helicase [Lysinibacillus varians]